MQPTDLLQGRPTRPDRVPAYIYMCIEELLRSNYKRHYKHTPTDTLTNREEEKFYALLGIMFGGLNFCMFTGAWVPFSLSDVRRNLGYYVSSIDLQWALDILREEKLVEVIPETSGCKFTPKSIDLFDSFTSVEE